MIKLQSKTAKLISLILTLLFISFLLNSCKKDNSPTRSFKIVSPMLTHRFDLGFAKCNYLLQSIGSYSPNYSFYTTVAESFLQYLSLNDKSVVPQSLLIPGSKACRAANGDKAGEIGCLHPSRCSTGHKVNVSSAAELYDVAQGSWIKTVSLNVKAHSEGGLASKNNKYARNGAAKKSNFRDAPISTFEVLSLN